MINKTLATVALTLAAGVAQATVLTFNDTHTASNQDHFFRFHVGQDNAKVKVLVNTDGEGWDAAFSLFKEEGPDWPEILKVNDANRHFNPGPGDDGLDDFNRPLKNDYERENPFKPGNADPGVHFGVTDGIDALSAGDYTMFVYGGYRGLIGSTFNTKFFVQDEGFESTNFYRGPIDFTVVIEGDSVSAVSAVPVPAALWLFGSAIAGLGAVRARKLSDAECLSA